MKHSKFTPGPWEASADPALVGDASVWGPDGDQVAAVWGNLALDGDGLDTARLIAAAPELYESLEECMYAIRDSSAIKRKALGVLAKVRA